MNVFQIVALALRHGRRLDRLVAEAPDVEDIDAGELKKRGVEAVVFDHDGVLGPSLSFGPDETGRRLVREALEVFGPGRVFVLSNTRSRKRARERSYRKTFPEAIYINARRKPDPEGLKIASLHSGVPADRIAVVDDGVLTGALMALEGGAVPVYARRRSLEEGLSARVFRIAATAPQRAFLKAAKAARAITKGA
ncbi:MAG: hypothetical protein ACNS63_01325 [Candidatus Nitrospinota bacterium M3_3B_026]